MHFIPITEFMEKSGKIGKGAGITDTEKTSIDSLRRLIIEEYLKIRDDF